MYSTDRGRVSPARSDAPVASSQNPPELNDGVVRIHRERGGRGGKVVTVIRGLPAGGAAPDALAAELKRLCGAGGTVKDRVIEIQGDHRQRVADRLRALGHRVKLAGG